MSLVSHEFVDIRKTLHSEKSIEFPKNLNKLRRTYYSMPEKVIITKEQIEQAKKKFFEDGGIITDQKSKDFKSFTFMTVEEKEKNAQQMVTEYCESS